jgi:hypothetical protein
MACSEACLEHRSGKPLLTQRAKYKDAEIETPGGHFEIEWYEGNKRCRKNVGEQPGDAVKALAKQKLKLEAQAAGIAVAEPEKANGKRSLKNAVDEFLAEKRRTKAKKTYQALKHVMEQFLEVCGRSYLEDIKRSDIMDKFVGALQHQGLADRTVHHRFAPPQLSQGQQCEASLAEGCARLRGTRDPRLHPV